MNSEQNNDKSYASVPKNAGSAMAGPSAGQVGIERESPEKHQVLLMAIDEMQRVTNHLTELKGRIGLAEELSDQKVPHATYSRNNLLDVLNHASKEIMDHIEQQSALIHEIENLLFNSSR